MDSAEVTDVVRRAGELVRQAAARFEEERQARLLDPAIVALRDHMQSVLAGEVERVKNQHGCTATAEAVEFALRRVVRQLLHAPTTRARELAVAGRHEEYTAALEALFGLQVEPSANEHGASENGRQQACPARKREEATGTEASLPAAS